MKNFKEFIESINEGLIKTHGGELTTRLVSDEMSLMNYDFNIEYIDNNKIELTLNQFNKISLLHDKFEHINSMLINRFGWFPSIMHITNLANKSHKIPYNEIYLSDNKNYIDIVKITYESKFDIEENVPKYLYHLTTKSHVDKIDKYGLSPKSKSKLSKHIDRIYVCTDIESCKNLIPRMKFYNKELEQSDLIHGKAPKRDYSFIIYRINTDGLDIKLYQDPNYIKGYYLIDNIPPDNLSIIYSGN